MSELMAVQKSQVLWRQGFKEEICITPPFIGRQCVSASAEVRVVADGDTYYLEIEVLGYTERYNLADACFPAVTCGVASLKVCVRNPDIASGALKSFDITAELCIGASILGQNLEKCWKVLDTRIVLMKAAASALLGPFQPLGAEKGLIDVNIPIAIDVGLIRVG